jgi:phage/plasmid-associated DNA primase
MALRDNLMSAGKIADLIQRTHRVTPAQAVNGHPAQVQTDYQALTQAEGRTDANNALRLVEKYQDDVIWVGAWDKFLLWDGTRWKIDQMLAIDLKAKDIAAGIFDEIAALVREENK